MGLIWNWLLFVFTLSWCGIATIASGVCFKCMDCLPEKKESVTLDMISISTGLRKMLTGSEIFCSQLKVDCICHPKKSARKKSTIGKWKRTISRIEVDRILMGHFCPIWFIICRNDLMKYVGIGLKNMLQGFFVCCLVGLWQWLWTYNNYWRTYV